MSATTTTSTTNDRRPRVEGIVPERRLLGIVLLVIGGILAAGFVVPAFDTYTLLAISLTCLTGFALTREYGYAIPAGITGGLGTAVLLITNGTFGPAMTPAVLFLSFAGGFWPCGCSGSGVAADRPSLAPRPGADPRIARARVRRRPAWRRQLGPDRHRDAHHARWHRARPAPRGQPVMTAHVGRKV